MPDINQFLESFFGYVKKPPAVKEQWEATYHRMIVHTRGVYPTDLIETTRPYEPQEIKKYRKAIYEPVTQDAIGRGIDSIYRTLYEANGNITPASTIADYIKTKRFAATDSGAGEDSQTFKEYMFGDVLRGMIDDPNGVLIWMPVSPDDYKGIPPNDIPPTEKVEVEPWLVNSSRFVHNTKDWFAFTGATLWAFKDGNKTVEKPYYWIMSKTHIYRYVPIAMVTAQEGTNIYKGVKYAIEIYYEIADEQNASFSLVPRRILGGNKSLDKEGTKYYQSYFNGYVAYGNEAIRAFSDNQGVMVMNNFPIKAEKGQKCKSCKFGKITDGNETYECRECAGTGYVISKSPYSIRVTTPPGTGDPAGDLEYKKMDDVRYYSPPIEALRESTQRWKDFIHLAEISINISFLQQAQSGVAKEIDRENLYAMLFKISENLFSLIKWSLDVIQIYRVPFARDRKDNVVTPPANFQIKTSKDLIEEIKALQTAPTAFSASTAVQLAKKQFYGNDVKIKIIESLAIYDPFFSYTSADILQIKASGELLPEDIPRHNYGNQIMTKVAAEMGEEAFLNAPYSTIETKANEKLDEIMARINVQQDPVVQSIISNAQT